jgi:hypothetical protein
VKWGVLLLVVLLVSHGCGLETIPILNPPFAVAPAGLTTFTFSFKSTNTNDPNEFLGYEVFYKFYAGTSGFPENPPATGVADVTWLQGLGYSTVCSSTDLTSGVFVSHSAPLIPVAGPPPTYPDRNSVFDITIDFNSLGTTSQPVLTYGGPTPLAPSILVRRDVGDTTTGNPTSSQAKAFIAYAGTTAYSPTDTDVQTIYSSVVGGEAYLVLYVASYGYSAAQSSYYYSLPVYLGFVPIYINQ